MDALIPRGDAFYIPISTLLTALMSCLEMVIQTTIKAPAVRLHEEKWQFNAICLVILGVWAPLI